MPSEFGYDAAGVYRGCAHAAVAMTPVELDCQEDVRGLRTPVGREKFVRSRLKVWIVQVDVAADALRKKR